MSEKTFTIEVGEKTFVTKRMNLTRRALFLRKIVAKSSPDVKAGDSDFIRVQLNSETMADLLEKELPEVAWEFIKDDDKKTMTFDIFKEDAEDVSMMMFLQWGLKAVKEIQNFLVEGTKKGAAKTEMAQA